MAIAACENELFEEFRNSARVKSIALTNIDVTRVCVRYSLEVSKMKSLPLIIKAMVLHKIKDGTLNAYLGEQDRMYAIGKFPNFYMYILFKNKSGAIQAVGSTITRKVSSGEYDKFQPVKGSKKSKD